MKLLVFGYGDIGRAFARRLAAEGWTIAATARSEDDRTLQAEDGVTSLDPSTLHAATADAVLVTAPPGDDGCPGLAALPADLGAAWTGYLSTTGVYGDREGRWVFEESPLAPVSAEGARRAAAEAGWTARGAHVFRLPGLYGPGRSAFDRLRDGAARRIVRPGQIFSRVHTADVVSGLAASLGRPNPGRAYNLCDDEPAPNADVIAHAARLLGVPTPPDEPFETAGLSPAARRFYAESKRVSNARAKAELGWRPAWPTYREGLAAILRAERAPPWPTEISTDRLILRPFTAEDAPAALAIQSDWNVIRNLRLATYPPTLEAMRAWLAGHEAEWRAGDAFRFAVVREGRLIGCCDLDSIARGLNSIGYWFEEAAWGQGYASEAARAVLAFGRERLGLNGFTSGHVADNDASGKVLVKLGFRRDGESSTWSNPRGEMIRQLKYVLD